MPALRRGSGRTRALSEARRLFTEQGYEATSIEDVLAASGLSRGALYHHFDTKAELFAAVLEDVEGELFARITQRAASATTAREALRLGALAFLEEAQEPTVRRLVLVDAPAVLGWARWREIDARFAFGALRAGLDAAIAAGELDVAPELAESIAHVLLASLMELALMTAQADTPEYGLPQATAALDRLLHGLWTRAD